MLLPINQTGKGIIMVATVFVIFVPVTARSAYFIKRALLLIYATISNVDQQL